MKHFFCISIALLICAGCNIVVHQPKIIPAPPQDITATIIQGEPTANGFPTITIQIAQLPKSATALEMVLIPAGKFMMGLSEDEIIEDRDDKYNTPQHEVTITRPFYIGKYEISQVQFETIMGYNHSAFQSDPNNPVVSINFHNTRRFISQMNQLNVGTFRLPTEAEWEYACRAGTTTRFSFGNAPECINKEWSQLANQYMWWGGNLETAMRGPMPIGQKLPNPWGLHDMHANVYEWCSDVFAPYSSEPQVDPQGPAKDGAIIFRGGPWNGEAQWCQSGRRNFTSPNNGYHWLGIRLVRDVDISAPE